MAHVHTAIPRLIRAAALFAALATLGATAAANDTASVAGTLQRLLADGAVAEAGEGDARAAFAAFYAHRAYRPYWIEDDGPGAAARALVARLREAQADGITGGGANPIAAFAAQGAADGGALAELELRLTAAYREFGWRLANGSSAERRADARWHIRTRPIEPLEVLDASPTAAGVRAALDALRPPHREYAALREALQRYRALERSGGWPAIGNGPTLDPGTIHPDVVVLRERLRLGGELRATPAAIPEEYDAAVQRAVVRFQQRHGLEPDGRVGSRTRAALSVPAAERVRQIARNLERWRWMPRALGERYVFVNIPRFELDAVEAGRVAVNMRVIVGRVSRPTPAFAGTLERMIVNPSWYVPSRIARVDLLPKQRNDAGYFASQNIRVFADPGHKRELDPASIEWQAVAAQGFPYYLRQDPGPGNSLGRLKFVVENPFDVYLHDTPARSLFQRPVRAFSSGCIRLEDAPGLAAFLMDDPGKWTPAHVVSMMDQGATVNVRLPRPVPVYVAYFTAWVDAGGEAHFRPDLYGRDARIGGCG